MKLIKIAALSICTSFIFAAEQEYLVLPRLFLDNSSYLGVPIKKFFDVNKDDIKLQILNKGLHENDRQQNEWMPLDQGQHLERNEIILVKSDKTLSHFQKSSWAHEGIYPYIFGVVVASLQDGQQSKVVIQIDMKESILVNADDILVSNKPTAKRVDAIGFVKPVGL